MCQEMSNSCMVLLIMTTKNTGHKYSNKHKIHLFILFFLLAKIAGAIKILSRMRVINLKA